MKTLVFAPHPDDETLSCGGYLLKEHKKGNLTKVVLITGGRTGPNLVNAVNLADERNNEFISACKRLSAEYEIYGFENNFFEGDKTKVIERIIKTIKNFKPEIVLIPQKEDIHRIHGDVYYAVKEAVYHCETGAYNSHSNGGIPRINLFCYESPKSELQIKGVNVCDISDFFDEKIKIFSECYKSQNVREFQVWPKLRTEYWGEKIKVKYGEAFMPDEIARLLIE